VKRLSPASGGDFAGLTDRPEPPGAARNFMAAKTDAVEF
jgi:hypothetical protein